MHLTLSTSSNQTSKKNKTLRLKILEGFLSFVTVTTDLVIPDWVVSYYLLLVISQELRCKGIWPYGPLLQAKTTQSATCWFEVLEDYGSL